MTLNCLEPRQIGEWCMAWECAAGLLCMALWMHWNLALNGFTLHFWLLHPFSAAEQLPDTTVIWTHSLGDLLYCHAPPPSCALLISGAIFFITSDLNLPSLSILTFLIASSSWVLMPLTSFFYFLIPFRLESYSCKLVASEKKLFKSMNAADGLSPNDLEALSPPNSSSFPSNSFSSSFNSRYRFRVTRFHSQSLSTTTTSANRVFEAPLWWWMCAQSVHPSPSGLN